MYSDQFGSIRERCLDLNLADHIGNAVHDIVAGQNLCAELHQLHNGLSVPCQFQKLGTDLGECFRVIQFQAACSPLFGEITGHMKHQFFLFLGI